jgi:tetratricopeptide (TPR) repeat protein
MPTSCHDLNVGSGDSFNENRIFPPVFSTNGYWPATQVFCQSNGSVIEAGNHLAKLPEPSDYRTMIKRFIPTMLFLGLILAALPRVSALQLDLAYLAEVRAGIRLTVTEQFDEARKVFQTMIDRDTADHAAYLLLAGVWHGEMFDREDYNARPRFDSLINKALSLSEKAITENRNPAWAHLTRGNAYAYIATLETKVGSWWSALRKGLAAKDEYLEALKLDPTLYDAYLGLGSYHYWKSAKTEFINWLPLVPDRKDEGCAELQLAIDSSLYSRDLAANSLLWIYLDWGRHEKAYDIATRLHQESSDSRLFTWGLAFSAYYSGHLREALEGFGKIIKMIEHQPGQNNFNTIECRFHRARIFQMLHERSEAITELQTLLNYPISEEIKDRQQEKLKKARELLEEMQKQ